MLAQPMRRQCFSMRRDRATFSPISVQAGEVRVRRAASALTATTLAPVAVEPMLTMRTSFLASLATFACLPSAVLTPSRRRSRK